jgi:hypothetical protein
MMPVAIKNSAAVDWVNMSNSLLSLSKSGGAGQMQVFAM